MKILVTGGAGFIGSHVVDRLLADGHDVAALDNLCTGRREHVDGRARLYVADIRDRAAVDAIVARERPDVVSHHAAQVDVRHSTDDPAYDAEVNLIGTVNLLESMVAHGVRRLVFASTGGAVYGEPQSLPVREDHPTRPLCSYGASKLAVEQYLYLYRHIHGLDSVILRYPNVYGPRQSTQGEAGVVAVFAERMIRGQPCVINGDGEQARDFVYVTDCAEANALALAADGAGDRTYNLGWGGLVTVNQVFADLAAFVGYTRPPVYGPAKPGETYRIGLDASRARRELGWRPRTAWSDGLARTVTYLAERVGEP